MFLIAFQFEQLLNSKLYLNDKKYSNVNKQLSHPTRLVIYVICNVETGILTRNLKYILKCQI